MKTLWSTGAAAILLGASWVPLTAQAAMVDVSQWQPYIGGQLSSQHLKYDDHDSGDSWAYNFGTASLQTGVNINSFLAVEGRIGKSFNNDEDNGETLKLKYYYGLYLKLGLPTGTVFTPYGIFGKTWGKVTDKDSSINWSHDSSRNGYSWGVGVQAAVSEHIAIALEYMDMYDKHDSELKNVGVLVNYVF